MSKSIKTKEPQIVNLKVRFTNKPITVMGGMKLIAEWFRKIELTEYMKNILTPLEPGSNRGYSPVTIVLAFITNVLMGAKKISHSVLLETDEPMKRIFGIAEVPSPSTYSRFFRRVKQSLIETIFCQWNTWLLNFRREEITKEITLDLDSSVFERYGEQEGAEVGYNPRKPGRPSHHPLFAVISDIKFVLHMWLRRGRTGSSSGVIEFMKEVLGRLPSWIKIKVIRADSGFFSGKFFDFLERQGLSYMVIVKLNRQVIEIVRDISVKKWERVAKGIEIGEAEYKAHDWQKARRIVVIRQHLVERPEAQGKLFPDMPNYRFQVITNLSWGMIDIWNYYRDRASVENYIKELKHDYSLHKFSFSKFYATEAALWFIVITWNLLTWFKKAILEKDNIRLMTVRLKYFLCGGILGNEHGNEVLRLHSGVKWKQTFLRLLNRINIFSVSNAMHLNLDVGEIM